MANEDPAYLEWIRSLPCASPDEPCLHKSEAHHKTGAGMGLRSPDWTAIPLCRVHHAAFHECRPPFDWTHIKRQLWHDSWARVLHHIYDNARRVYRGQRDDPSIF